MLELELEFNPVNNLVIPGRFVCCLSQCAKPCQLKLTGINKYILGKLLA